LNPVEYCFNTIRQAVEAQRPRTEAELRAAIEIGIDRVSPNMQETFTCFRRQQNHIDEADLEAVEEQQAAIQID
jgi:hypothetical protein